MTAIAVTPTKGPNPTTIVAGRSPTRTGEIALGRRTMHQLHVGVGDRVSARDRTGHTRRIEVVGQAVFPGLAAYPGEDPTSLGSGALVTERAFHEMGAPLGSDLVLLRWHDPRVTGPPSAHFGRSATTSPRARGRSSPARSDRWT